MRDLLLLQLGFNILILCALLMLAWSGGLRRKAREKKPGKPREAKSSEKAARPATTAPSVPRETEARPTTHLDGLLERENAKELVAEQALRARLDRFRGQAVN